MVLLHPLSRSSKEVLPSISREKFVAINLGGTTDINQFKGSEGTDSNRPETDQKTDQKNDQKTKILELMRDNPSISRAEIALELGIHESSVKRRLESLISNGRICRVGPDKGGHWEVIDLQ